jgi:putative inorganic carbon (hco3(-)) transporter
MGYYVILFYLAFMIASPGALFPELAPYRLQIWVGALATLLTVMMMPLQGYPFRNLQVGLTAGFFSAILLSRLFLGWLGGTVAALAEYGAVAIVFFMLVGAVPSLQRLRMLAITLVIPAIYAGIRGIMAVFYDVDRLVYIYNQNVYDFTDGVMATQVVDRIRFVGSFADPNDLAQYFLVCIPFVLLMWKKGSPVRNFMFVSPIVLFLLGSMYLTHSRGSLIGLLVVTMVYLSARVGKALIVISSAGMFVLLVAANFAGGRAISFSSGSDRIEAWGAGLSMLRGRPLFGIGFNLFTEHNDITAHNSFVLCIAELGLVGCFFWLALVVSTILGLTRFIKSYQSVPAAANHVRWAAAIRVALSGFIATSWFLSRTYSILLLVLVAMWVLLELAAKRLPLPPEATGSAVRVRASRGWHWATTTATVEMVGLLVVYVMVRARWSN